MLNEIDLRQLWKELDDYEQELDKEKDTLHDVWLKIAELKSKTEVDLDRLNSEPEFDFIDLEDTVTLNVGGIVFETSCAVLTRDPYSILAAVCRKSTFSGRADNFVYFDRDWWIFRHIMNYLQSSTLPTELETLQELYTEASFYRLESLQRSIQNIPVDSVDSSTMANLRLR